MEEYVLNYLNKVGVGSVDELSDEQVVLFFKDENEENPIGLGCMAIDSAMRFGGIKKEDIVKSMRKSMKTFVLFECVYIDGESAYGAYEGERRAGWHIYP